ncbi:peptidoglycan-binding protein [Hyalangium rubrum]|uniref:D-alanyl-D-alanine carboxypeptidase family protein n=1 Tax=Hyalangium rubrum TaxID=3103134 RepID=A0ABU5H986_9BACT|nr:peptidoglycan-binding protein [Hyalangium sp. s54d21]MDY7229875.1 D-alanyl-D-alanine carboxypeptidase family protein [Hyalangium sp. s54d21]
MTTVNAARATAATRGAQASLPTLREGARGASVTQLQNLLRNKGYNIAADGVFGPKTEAAVKKFQQAKGLAVDGIVGPQTWGALRGTGGTGGTGGAGGVSQPPASGGGKQVQAYVAGQPRNITVQSVGNGQYLQADAARNFKAMQAAASRAGVNLSATSGFRTMDQQRALYQKYLNGTGNLAAKPGYSNHQNGISMDVGGVGGYNTKAYNWLKNNAANYGFKNDVAGEYWHWTFKG